MIQNRNASCAALIPCPAPEAGGYAEFSNRSKRGVPYSKLMKPFHAILVCLILQMPAALLAGDWVQYNGKSGPGKGKHIVLLAGDDEYRSEEGLPQLGKILAVRHGFKCTVLFSVNPTTGEIDPNDHVNLPGLEALDTADLCVMLWRFREPTDDKMKHFANYLNSGKPIIALRTSTHAFSFDKNKQSAYLKYDWRSKEWVGGFGQHVLGDTWISHHGNHGKESTRGVINPAFKDHPILKGVTDIWGPSDVYGIIHLPADAKVLAYGQILAGMKPTDGPVQDKRNDPMMPLIWIRDYKGEKGKTSKILATTMGAATDLESEGLRRLLVNGAYWALGMDKKIKEGTNVDYVGQYKPTPFGFNTFQKGVKPSAHELDPNAK